MSAFTFILFIAVVSAFLVWQSKRKASQAYPKAGTTFVYALIAVLGLTDWDNGLPIFTEEEQKALKAGLDRLQRDADAEGGGHVVFHPDIAPVIQRQIGAEALKELAAREGATTPTNEIPATTVRAPTVQELIARHHWKRRVSTYLKAWTMNLDPTILIEVSDLLRKAGYERQAKDALDVVVSHFKAYAPRFFAGADKGNILTTRVIIKAQMRMNTL